MGGFKIKQVFTPGTLTILNLRVTGKRELQNNVVISGTTILKDLTANGTTTL